MNNCECDKCEYCKGYLHDTRRSFTCNHPNYEYISNYFKENNIHKMTGFIGFGEKFADVPKNKTTPKWCPKKAGAKNENML